jgi:hypothetical protein
MLGSIRQFVTIVSYFLSWHCQINKSEPFFLFLSLVIFRDSLTKILSFLHLSKIQILSFSL